MPKKGTIMNAWSPGARGRHDLPPGHEETSLAAAIILQAFRDATTEWKDYNLSGSARQEAYDFLTADAGEWADSRREWCAVLGLPDSALRRIADIVFHGPPEARAAIEARIREMWKPAP